MGLEDDKVAETETSVETLEDVLSSVNEEEFTEGDTDTETDEKPEVEVKPEETQPEKENWDKERQRADQAEANFRKAQAAQEQAVRQAQDASKKAELLEAKLSELAKANNVNLDDIDADLIGDPKLISVLKSMKTQVDAANDRAAKLEEKAKQYETIEEQRAVTARQEEAKAEIIADIELDYPAKFRNDAIAKANQICEKRGYPPKDRYEAARILRSCYKDVASAKPAAVVKKPVQVDTGKGGSAIKADKPKSGSIRSLANEWRQKLKT